MYLYSQENYYIIGGQMVEMNRGWKGYLGSILVILSGLYLISQNRLQEAVTLIGMGLALLGIRHKLSYGEEE